MYLMIGATLKSEYGQVVVKTTILIITFFLVVYRLDLLFGYNSKFLNMLLRTNCKVAGAS